MEEYRVRHIKLFFQKYPSALKQVRTLKNISGGKKCKVLIPTIKQCCTPGKITDPNIDTWYTDSSGISNCFGASTHVLMDQGTTTGRVFLWAASL